MKNMRDWVKWAPQSLLRLMKSPLAADVAVLAGGAGVAQVITVAFSPVITRLYGPEAYGILGVFSSIIAMIVPVATLAYGDAIALPACDDEARTLARLSVRIGVAVAAVSAGVFGGFRYRIAAAMGSVDAAPYLMLIPITLMSQSVTSVLLNWLIRKRRFRAVSCISIAQASAVSVSKAGVGLVAPTAPALMILTTMGNILGMGLLWKEARPTISGRRGPPGSATMNCSAARTRMREAASAYRDFPLYRAPWELVAVATQEFPTFLIAVLLGPVSAGLYTLSRKALSLPASLLARAIGRAILPRMAEAAQRGTSLRHHLVRATGGLAVTCALPFGLVVALAPTLFGVVFGSEWASAGHYARWLALWAFADLIAAPSDRAAPLLNLQRQLLRYELARLCLLIGALSFGRMVFAGDMAAIALLSGVGALTRFGQVAWILLCSGNRLRTGLGGSPEGGPPESI